MLSTFIFLIRIFSVALRMTRTYQNVCVFACNCELHNFSLTHTLQNNYGFSLALTKLLINFYWLLCFSL